MSDYKNYYTILGVSKKSSLEEIKKAFRTLARKYHPDITKNNKVLEKRFKDIAEAYEVLSDNEKRKKYDKLSEKDWNNVKNQVDKKKESNTFSSFFQSLFGTVKDNTIKNIKKINDIEKNISITLEEAYNGVQKDVSLPIEEDCPKCNGEGGVMGTVCSKCHGKGFINESKILPVKIPSGVFNGSKLSIKNEGYGSGVLKGDLYLNVSVDKHIFFEVDENNNVVCELPITVTEAILGTDVEVPTLKNPVKMKIPQCTQPNQTLRLKGKGLKKKNEDTFADQLIKVSIILPKKISAKETELYTELSKIESIFPRENFYK
ncbi:MAG: DnaJ C-terminal domain-containing protein [Candidatus Sericytochromatia bacterium]